MEKSFWQYWQIVWREARNKTYKALGFGLRIIGIVISAIGGGLISYSRGGNMLDNFMSAGIGVAIWMGIWFLYFTFFSVKEPALIYSAQEKVIGDFKEKWGLDKIKTNKIYLHPSKESIDHRAILSIENNESVDLSRCYGHAIKVMVGDGKHWENRTHIANSGGELLTWFIHGDAVEWTIKRNTSEELLCVAIRHDSGRLGFTHPSRANTINKDNTDASIYVEIQIDGYMNEKPIEPIYFKGFIRQDGNDIYLEEGELP